IPEIIPGAIGHTTENNIGRSAENSVEFLILFHQLGIQPHEELCFECQLFRALQNTLLEFAIQSFEQPRLSVQIGEHSDLRAQQFRNHRNRNVIHRAMLVTFKLVQVGEMNGGDKDDCSALKAGVLPDHCSQLEAIELRHAHIHQHNCNV